MAEIEFSEAVNVLMGFLELPSAFADGANLKHRHGIESSLAFAVVAEVEICGESGSALFLKFGWFLHK